MKERILEFLKAENKTSAQLADEIGVQPSGISHILSGRNKPSLDFVMKMLEKYKFLSMEWLLFGKGNMYKEPSMQTLFEESAEKPEQKIETGKRVKENDVKKSEGVEISQKYETKQGRSELKVEKIVWFYNNNNFREFFPEED